VIVILRRGWRLDPVIQHFSKKGTYMETSPRARRLLSLTIVMAMFSLTGMAVPLGYSPTRPFGTGAGNLQRGAHLAVFPSLSRARGLPAITSGALVVSAPANDDFDEAQMIEGDSGGVLGDNFEATVEVGEPDHAGHSTGITVWYEWQAVDDGDVTFDTMGSDFDTVLAVYTGTSVGALTEVTSSDDVISDVWSRVTFNASTGIVYHLAVDSFDGYAWPGHLALNWQPGTGPAPAPTPGPNDQIVFTSYRGSTSGIFVMNADGSSPQRLTDKGAYDNEPVWSPDGAKIAFTSSRDGSSHIYVMNADGTNQTRVTQNPTSGTVADYSPAWSPDATKILFQRFDAGGDSDIYVVNADGSLTTALTTDGLSYAPLWSPDGSEIAFISGRDWTLGLYVMNADGSLQTQLSNSFDYSPAWSPDGAKIAFVTERDGSPEIYVIDADGSDLTNLSNTSTTLPYPPSNNSPAWSPDGAMIAFVSNRDGQPEVYVMDSDGSDPTRLTALYDSYAPSWSPDGTKLGFLSYRDGNQEIYIMNADGSGQTNVTGNIALDDIFDWQPAP
jgi:Tol biopolymer transport system component